MTRKRERERVSEMKRRRRRKIGAADSKPRVDWRENIQGSENEVKEAS